MTTTTRNPHLSGTVLRTSQITTPLSLTITPGGRHYYFRPLLFATPWTAACQVPLSIGFSRQGYWSELPFPALGARLGLLARHFQPSTALRSSADPTQSPASLVPADPTSARSDQCSSAGSSLASQRRGTRAESNLSSKLQLAGNKEQKGVAE